MQLISYSALTNPITDQSSLPQYYLQYDQTITTVPHRTFFKNKMTIITKSLFSQYY